MTDTRIDQILRRIRERAHPYHETDRPDHEMRDHLVRWLYGEYIAMSPEEDERALREIRRVTRT